MGVADLRSILSNMTNAKSGGGSGGSNTFDPYNPEKLLIHYHDWDDDSEGERVNTIEITELHTEDDTPLITTNYLNWHNYTVEYVYPQFSVVLGAENINNISIIKKDEKYYYYIFSKTKYGVNNAKAGGTYDSYYEFYIYESSGEELVSEDIIYDIYDTLLDNPEDIDLISGLTLIHKEYIRRYSEGA